MYLCSSDVLPTFMSPRSTIFPSGFLILPQEVPLLLPARVRPVRAGRRWSSRSPPPPPRVPDPGTREDPDSRKPGFAETRARGEPELAGPRRDPPAPTLGSAEEEVGLAARAGQKSPAQRPPGVSRARRSAPGPPPGPPPVAPPHAPGLARTPPRPNLARAPIALGSRAGRRTQPRGQGGWREGRSGSSRTCPAAPRRSGVPSPAAPRGAPVRPCQPGER